ncbi:MAG: efflux RND transporter periplasmic adaptor subunit [Caulobacteraceae bacterium]|nr:efflux RND transporter periplasmic adaptor subunit [Caulobacteraceae bacterium]
MIRPNLRLARALILPALAGGLIIFALTVIDRPASANATPPAPPAGPSGDLGPTVAGLGLVEPASELISVAAEAPGVVRAIHVRPGQQVTAGAPLLTLDQAAASADLSRAQAALRVAEATAADAAARAALFERLDSPAAVSRDERDRALYAARIAAANVALARAEVTRAEVERDRRVLRAPISGQVLRLNVRLGEYVAAGPVSDPLVAMGQVDPLHVRVRIDEEDVGAIQAGAAAEGSLRGAAGQRAPLTFVRFEPLAQPKRNLNGGAERVDTRVVEAIYAFDPETLPAFIGQQMDVFIARERPAAGAD